MKSLLYLALFITACAAMALCVASHPVQWRCWQAERKWNLVLCLLFLGTTAFLLIAG